jgi:hypothetical protein
MSKFLTALIVVGIGFNILFPITIDIDMSLFKLVTNRISEWVN